MSIFLKFFLFGFAFIELTGLRYARAEVQCPNAPVAPIPVTPYPIVPTQTNCCPNQQINPCPVPATNTVCCNQFQTTQCCQNCATQSPCSSSTSCCSNSNIPCSNTVPSTNTVCSNQFQTTQCCQNCATQTSCGSTTSCSNSNIPSSASNTQCNNSVKPCYSPTTPCYPSTNNCSPQPPCTQTETTTTTTTTTTNTEKPEPITTTPPPGVIIKCPTGTILIGNTCSLIYCPPGYQMINDRCKALECPAGTVWIGHRCSVPEPVVHNVTYYNTIITKFNETKPNIILNNTNNIIVNASVSLDGNTNDDNNDCNNDYGDCDETPIETTTSTVSAKCCTVMSPRICENHNDRWKCYSRRSHRCGDFCTAPIIYLKAPRVQVRPNYIVIPPIQQDCLSYGNCGPQRYGHDCSGCAVNNMERCSHYCSRYVCPSQRCDFYDQEKYCTQYGGSYGCQEEDGCFDNWCQ